MTAFRYLARQDEKMITRKRLIAGLHELSYVEEGMVTLYANFAKALVEHTDGLEKKKKEEMRKLLSTLHRDSARHKETVDEMILQLEKSIKNEY